jgi:hypothetical protein
MDAYTRKYCKIERYDIPLLRYSLAQRVLSEPTIYMRDTSSF